ncbi:MAG TPA: hypothetical protein VMS17_25040 [Gemmataceae bacterium]|nr:hypothetical protein [Gemmataceae bacterium]
MDPIRLIRDKSELRGTCYFELLPGEYRERCWNDSSVFLAEEVFALIEPVIARHEPRFDHYAFVGTSRSTWERIIADLERVAEFVRTAESVGELRGQVGFFFTTSESEFAADFKPNAEALVSMIGELVSWLRDQLKQQACVSILGM